MLRHQLAVAERERPNARARLTSPYRAWLALLARTVPAGRMAGMRLLVTPGTSLALASRHRPPPVGAPVAVWPVRAAGHARQGAVGSAASRPGERVLGLPADPRRARGTGHHRGAVHGLGDPQKRRDRPGAVPRRSRVGRVPAIAGAGDLGPGLLHRRPPQRRQGARGQRSPCAWPRWFAGSCRGVRPRACDRLEIPLPSVTASGSPNRHHRPPAVRYLSVTGRLVECVTEGAMASAVGSNVLSALDYLIIPAGQHGITERNTESYRRPTDGPEAGTRAFCPARASDPGTVRSAGRRHSDKIANHPADLRKLPSVISGRCWVRTNVGVADGFTDRSLWPLGQPASCRWYVRHSEG
jgi:hypothetical protein